MRQSSSKRPLGRMARPMGVRLVRGLLVLLLIALVAGGCTLFFDTDPGRAPVASDAGTTDGTGGEAQNGQ